MADSILCNWLDLRAAIEQPPKPLDFVLPGLKSGTVGAIVSPGATGKTMLALQAAVTVASGVDTLELAALGWRPVGGRVLFLSGEDPDDVLAERIHHIGQRLTHGPREALFERLAIAPLMGRGPDLMTAQWRDWLATEAPDTRLIVIDTLRRFHHLDENDGGQMASLIAYLEQICREHSTTILFLHHTSKAGALSGAQQASRGSSVLTDNARFQANLVTMMPSQAEEWGVDESCRRSFVRLSFAKLNYSAPLPDCWFRRREGGVLEPAVLDTSGSKLKAKWGKSSKAIGAPVAESDDERW
jgi:RecA-family ATPase